MFHSATAAVVDGYATAVGYHVGNFEGLIETSIAQSFRMQRHWDEQVRSAIDVKVIELPGKQITQDFADEQFAIVFEVDD